jgi:hypothetical protein
MPLFRRGAYRIQSAKPIEPLIIRGEEAFFIGLLQGDAPIPGQQPLDCKLSEQIRSISLLAGIIKAGILQKV